MTTMVRVRANRDQSVHAPAPALGRPSIPAPTQTLAIMHAPPINEGCFDMIIILEFHVIV
ncbi:hypothetical protein VV208B2_40350 [Vibrio vulnificus]|nr:hypothetical protein VV208B2_40350 [Vibrio vulnificus]